MPKSFDSLQMGAENSNVTFNYIMTWVPSTKSYRYEFTGTTTQTFNMAISRKTRSFSGVRTAGYQAIKRAGGILPTTVCSDTFVVSQGIQTATSEYGYGSANLLRTTYNRNVVLHLDPYPFGGHQKATEIAWSKLRQSVLNQDVNVGVMLAEANKTSAMIYETARKFALAIKALKKGNVVKAGTLLGIETQQLKKLRKDVNFDKRNVHKNWLELQYGWKPLLMDIHGSAKTIANSRFSKPKIFRKQSTSSFSTAYVLNQTKANANVTGKAWVTYSISNDGIVAANSVGLLNPLSIAWELVPFSFVADWFVNIGDVLQECTAFAGLRILDSGQSIKVVSDGVVKSGVMPVSKTRVVHTTYSRAPVPNIPIPKLRVKSNPFSTGHILNGVALLREVLNKRH